MTSDTFFISLLTQPILGPLGLIDLILITCLMVAMPIMTLLERQDTPPEDGREIWRASRLKRTMLILWGLTAFGFLVMVVRGSQPADMLMGPGREDWRLYLGYGLAGLTGLVMAYNAYKLTPESARAVMETLKGEPMITALTPDQGRDYPLWAGVSLTAGITEEVLYRGLLIGLLTPILGLYGAAVCAGVGFILAHAYQGAKGMMQVSVITLPLTGMVLLTETIWPAVLLHALIDLMQGWLVMRAKNLAGSTNAQQPQMA